MQSVLLSITLLIIAAIASSIHTLTGPEAPPPEISTSTTPPLSQQALVGKLIFFDTTLSSSGKLSCASCHSPAKAYGPPNARAVQLGGPTLHTAGIRSVPSLRYTLARTPIWAHPQPTSLAERVLEKDNFPVGGFAWDGRFNTLHEQAAFPLLAPTEMASHKQAIAARIQHGPYANQFLAAFGQDSLSTPDKTFAAALLALERFQLEDASFHPYSSKYDLYLDGKATLTPQEARGLKLFNDNNRGNCASCHLSARGADGSHPLFTDFQFEAIGVPRNPEIPANKNLNYYDMGLCGPIRKNQPATTYCGMFKTPSLRNVATRQVFFHNGRFHTLKEALRFYVQRDTEPAKWYPHSTNTSSTKPYDDLPSVLRINVDRTTLPFSGNNHGQSIWTEADIDDVTAFLQTLTDNDQTIPPTTPQSKSNFRNR
jgi:cytochrome c peroxidase